MIKIDARLYTYSESKILCKYFELISLRSIKIPKVRELNFWREEEEDETLVCIYISPYGKYLKKESICFIHIARFKDQPPLRKVTQTSIKTLKNAR